MAIHTRRKTPSVTSKTGVRLEIIYCRKCMKQKPPAKFYTSVDPFLDSNGFFSICKECCNTIFDKMLQNEGNLGRALLKTCRLLNIKYDESALASTQLQIANKQANGKIQTGFFGVYKCKLMPALKMAMTQSKEDIDLSFQEPTQPIFLTNDDLDFQKSNVDLKYFWGDGFQESDYSFLESELSEWKNKHKCDTKAEEMLLKEICLKSLDIRRQRNLGSPTATLVKELQELMKTASVDPSKTSVAGSGKSQDTFSSFIKTIEENEPAEYYKDKGLFKDFDNIDYYFKKYLTRPLKNFITQSRDFSLEGDDGEDYDEDIIINAEEIINGNSESPI